MAPFLVSWTSTATIVLGNGRVSSLSSGANRSGGSGEYNVSVNNTNWNWTCKNTTLSTSFITKIKMVTTPRARDQIYFDWKNKNFDNSISSTYQQSVNMIEIGMIESDTLQNVIQTVLETTGVPVTGGPPIYKFINDAPSVYRFSMTVATLK